MNNKITKKELKEIFENSVLFFVNYFSLKNYEIIFEWKKDETIRASTNADYQNKIVIFNIGENWVFDLNEKKENNKKQKIEEIQRIAFHEVMELLFIPIRNKLDIFYSFEIVDELIHDKIVLFENTVFPLIKK